MAVLSISDSTAVRSGPHCGPPPNRTAIHFNPLPFPPTAVLFISTSTAVHFSPHCCSFHQALLSIGTAVLLGMDRTAARLARSAVQTHRSAVDRDSSAVRVNCSAVQCCAKSRAPVGRSGLQCGAVLDASHYEFPPRNGVCCSSHGNRRAGSHDVVSPRTLPSQKGARAASTHRVRAQPLHGAEAHFPQRAGAARLRPTRACTQWSVATSSAAQERQRDPTP